MEAGARFKKVAEEETAKLEKLAEIGERHVELNNGIPDDYKEILRCAAGQARLLAKSKLQQFLNLCQSNLEPDGNEPHITDEDLAGFWDLVLIQIRKLHSTFEKLALISKDNWKTPSELFDIRDTQTDRDNTPTNPSRSKIQRCSSSSLPTAKSKGSKKRAPPLT